jgi:hypothetical protein
MKKIGVLLVAFLFVSVLMVTVTGQPDTPADSTANWIFGALTVVVLAVFVAIIAYAAFKLLRKWSS